VPSLGGGNKHEQSSEQSFAAPSKIGTDPKPMPACGALTICRTPPTPPRSTPHTKDCDIGNTDCEVVMPASLASPVAIEHVAVMVEHVAVMIEHVAAIDTESDDAKSVRACVRVCVCVCV
jgi:hypothetical protein